eukprot:CFRG5321T1
MRAFVTVIAVVIAAFYPAYSADILANDAEGLATTIETAASGDTIVLQSMGYSLSEAVVINKGITIAGSAFDNPAIITTSADSDIPFSSTIPLRFALNDLSFKSSMGYRALCNITETTVQSLSKLKLMSSGPHDILPKNRVRIKLDLGPWVNRRQIEDINVGNCSYRFSNDTGVAVFSSIVMFIDATDCHAYLHLVLNRDDFMDCGIDIVHIQYNSFTIFEVKVTAMDQIVLVNLNTKLQSPLIQKVEGELQVGFTADTRYKYSALTAVRWMNDTQFRTDIKIPTYARHGALYSSGTSEFSEHSSLPIVGHSNSLGVVCKIVDGEEIEVGQYNVETECVNQSKGARCDQMISLALRGCDFSGQYALKSVKIACDQNIDETCPEVTALIKGDLDLYLTVSDRDFCEAKSKADAEPLSAEIIEDNDASTIGPHELNGRVKRVISITPSLFHDVLDAKITTLNRTSSSTRACIPDYFKNSGLVNQTYRGGETPKLDVSFVATSEFACATEGLGTSSLVMEYMVSIDYTSISGESRRRRRETSAIKALQDVIVINYEDGDIDPGYIARANQFDETGEVVSATSNTNLSDTIATKTPSTSVVYKNNNDVYIIIGCVTLGVLLLVVGILLALAILYIWKTNKSDAKARVLATGNVGIGSMDTLQRYRENPNGMNSAIAQNSNYMNSAISQNPNYMKSTIAPPLMSQLHVYPGGRTSQYSSSGFVSNHRPSSISDAGGYDTNHSSQNSTMHERYHGGNVYRHAAEQSQSDMTSARLDDNRQVGYSRGQGHNVERYSFSRAKKYQRRWYDDDEYVDAASEVSGYQEDAAYQHDFENGQDNFEDARGHLDEYDDDDGRQVVHTRDGQSAEDVDDKHLPIQRGS